MAETWTSSATMPRNTMTGFTQERPPLAGGLVSSDRKLPEYHRKLTISYQWGSRLGNMMVNYHVLLSNIFLAAKAAQ